MGWDPEDLVGRHLHDYLHAGDVLAVFTDGMTEELISSLATIRERLSMRDFMENLRSSGVQTGGPAAFSHADRQAFANQLARRE